MFLSSNPNGDNAMRAIETNQSLATLLGWTPADFGASSFDASLIAAIRDVQGKLGVDVDGLCGKYTYGALLVQQKDALLAQRSSSTDWLADAGAIAMYEAKLTWLRNIVDLPPANDARYESCRKAIDDMIRSPAGLAWTWQAPYQDNYEWCGAFAGFSWRAAGLLIALRKTYFASTYRLDRYGRYENAFENTPNPRPASGPERMITELNEHSGPFDAHFTNDDLPRAGDILLVGGKNTAYGKHVTLVESYDVTSGMFTTLEGNATGPGPTGGKRHGVIRARRPVGLPNGLAPTTYHARRLIRPAPADLA
jgi:hypothetical protein